MKHFKRDNRGATMLLVIVAICFIGILGSLILSLTLTNIRVKQIDYESKANFYQTETSLDEIKVGLEILSSNCMHTAYSYILLHYSAITQDPTKSLKTEFDKLYINELVKALSGSDYDVTGTFYYKPNVLKNYLLSTPVAERGNVLLYADTDTTTNLLKITLDTSLTDTINSVVLKDIKLKFLDSNGFETTINTDICLESPNMEFSMGGIYPEFTKYALIADKQISALSGTGMSITGNIYAGADGIKVDAVNVTTEDSSIPTGYNLKINGDTIITRGDIKVSNYAKLYIGDNMTTNVWAENILTENNTSQYSAFLYMNGDIKVADDLMLNAKNSKVIVKGTYSGYNYNQYNAVVTDMSSAVDSKYSSSILINGSESSLDMFNLTSLNVAGRAFISRFSEKKSGLTKSGGSSDIMLGESISIKSDQIAYLVPSKYIWSGCNPVNNADLDSAIAAGKVTLGVNEVNFSTAPNSLKTLLSTDATPGYTEYYYKVGGATIKYYFLEFKNQKAANTYFSSYASDANNMTSLENSSKKYLVDTGNGIQLSSNLLLAANALSFDADGKATLHPANIGDPDNPSATLLNEAIMTAKEYKSRQLTLTAARDVTGSDFRLDKVTNPLFRSIISYVDSPIEGPIPVIHEEASSIDYGFVSLDSNTRIKIIPIVVESVTYYVYIIDNPSTVFELKDYLIAGVNYTMDKGIVVATGDIKIGTNFEGMIISGGTITMNSNNLSVKSNTALVQDIFSNAIEMERTTWKNDDTKKFIHYFKDYENVVPSASEKIDQVDIAQYVYYENWKKNVE